MHSSLPYTYVNFYFKNIENSTYLNSILLAYLIEQKYSTNHAALFISYKKNTGYKPAFFVYTLFKTPIKRQFHHW